MADDLIIDNHTLAQICRRWRDERDMTAVEAAVSLGIAARTYTGIEQGRGFRNPKLLLLAMRAIDIAQYASKPPGRMRGSHMDSEELAQARELINGGGSVRMVAEALGVSIGAIVRRIRAGELPKTQRSTRTRSRAPLTADEIAIASKLLLEGESVAATARAVGVSTPTISSRIKAGTLPPSKAGTTFRKQRISEALKSRIIEIGKATASYKQILAVTGVSHRVARNILREAGVPMPTRAARAPSGSTATNRPNRTSG